MLFILFYNALKNPLGLDNPNGLNQLNKQKYSLLQMYITKVAFKLLRNSQQRLNTS